MSKKEVANKINSYFCFQGEDKIKSEDVIKIEKSAYQIGDLVVYFNDKEIDKISQSY